LNEPTSATPLLEATSLNASLTVANVEASAAWYQKTLGFRVEQRHERNGKLAAISLSAGVARILVAQDDGAKGKDRVKGQGISLQLTTTQDIDTIANRAKASGTALESEPATMPWGARVFRVKDPDGFLLVISSPR
jgi:uncharacterized glyoxalase superfamily protein PhnB